MSKMFHNAIAFDRPLDKWNVRQVTDMSNMFCGASKFNRSSDFKNVSNVETMTSMFDGATLFDQPLDKWKVSNVRDMNNMFRNGEKSGKTHGNSSRLTLKETITTSLGGWTTALFIFCPRFLLIKSIVRRNSKNKNGNYVPLLLHGWYYNEGMGGTDRFDQYGSYYNTSLRTRKWHIRIFTHFLQAAVINAYILYVSKYKASLPYIEFLDLLIGQLVDDPKEIVDSDSESSEIEVKPAHNPKKRWRTTWQNDHSRLCGEHFPVQHSQNGRDTRTLCMFCKKRKPSQKCSTCGVSLCTLEEGDVSPTRNHARTSKFAASTQATKEVMWCIGIVD